MKRLAIVILLLTIACSLTVGPFACCTQNLVFDEETLRCVCPLHLPHLLANGTCIACSAPARWEASTSSCLRCRSDQTEAANGNCLCPKATPFDNGKICTECPENLPVWNGYKCVACPAATHFDYDSKTCTVCPEGFTYVPAARKCEISLWLLQNLIIVPIYNLWW